MTTISGHAAPHRLSGFFPLPSYAGIFSCMVFYISLYLIFIQKKNYFFLILIFICSLYFGFRSNSTIFLIGWMIIVFNLFFYSKFLKFKNLFYFISFLILLLIIFYVYNYGAKEEYAKFLFGGRFIENAKVSIFINNFTLSNFLLGANLNYIPYFVTDNMIAIRLYTFGFFITLLIYYLYFKSLRFIPNHNYNYVIFFILFLSEMGVRALGGPEVFFLFYVLSFYLNRFKKSLK